MAEKGGVVLVTGAGGLIGRRVVEALSGDYTVVGFDVVPEPEAWPHAAAYVRCDLASEESVERAIGELRASCGGRLASVVHLAAYYDFSGEASEKYETITVGGTRRLLAQIQDMRVEQFVFSSTMLVHAPTQPGRPINEDWPIAPKWAYPESKVRTERLLREQHGSIPIVLLRIAGVYDDYCRAMPLSHQIQRIYERWMTGRVYPGNLEHGQAFVHVSDVVGAFVNAVDRRDELPAELPLLIGEDETLSYRYLQREFSRLIFGEPLPTYRVPRALAQSGAWVQEHVPFGDPFIKAWMIDLADDHYELDIARARAHLGWQPGHCLCDSLASMVHQLKADPVQWYREHKLAMPGWLERRIGRRAG